MNVLSDDFNGRTEKARQLRLAVGLPSAALFREYNVYESHIPCFGRD